MAMYRMEVVANFCWRLCLLFIVQVIITSCEQSRLGLRPVSVADFEKFVAQTGYVTDAERYGWSIVQLDVYDFITRKGAHWRKPNGLAAANDPDLPVTQVSFNDALAYCQWANVRLPTYDEYWDLVRTDERTIVSENLYPISAVDKVNILGNVWDITEPNKGGQVRLAGGSLFCSMTTCNGTVADRMLYVYKETGNIHIGFSVIFQIN